MTVILKSDSILILQSRWRSTIIGHKFDAVVAVRAAESRAIGELGIRNLRRLQYHDPTAPGWRVIGRLLRPLEAINAGLDSPPTAHRRRVMEDAIAVLRTRCAELGQTFWGWSTEEWIHLLGRVQGRVLRRNAPSWAGDEVRPYLAAHAYLVGSFTEFHQLGSFQRLTLPHTNLWSRCVRAALRRRRKTMGDSSSGSSATRRATGAASRSACVTDSSSDRPAT